MPGEEELIRQRRDKLDRLRARGIDPYPARVSRTHTSAAAIAAFEVFERASENADPPAVTVAGRITSMRDMGKASFLDLRDGEGRIQCYLKRDSIGADVYAGLADFDLGDFALVSGPLMRTRTGEVTVDARSIEMTAKALRPPPE